jgi:hypothetical protein
MCAANDMARDASGSGLRLKPTQSVTPRTPKVMPLTGIDSEGASPTHTGTTGSTKAGSAKAHFASLFALQRPAGSGAGDAGDNTDGNGMYTLSGSSDAGERAVSVKVGSFGCELLAYHSAFEPQLMYSTCDCQCSGKLSGNLTPTAEAGAAFRPADGRRTAPVRSSLKKRSLSLRTGREVFMLGQV